MTQLRSKVALAAMLVGYSVGSTVSRLGSRYRALWLAGDYPGAVYSVSGCSWLPYQGTQFGGGHDKSMSISNSNIFELVQ